MEIGLRAIQWRPFPFLFLLQDGLIDIGVFSLKSIKVFFFSLIDYMLDAKGKNNILKEIVLHFDNETEDIGGICDKIRALGKDDEIAAKTKVELSGNTIKLTFEGKASEINHMMSVITGGDEIGVSYANESKWLVPLENTIVEDIVDFEGIAYKDPNGSEYWQIPVNYTAKIYGVGQEVINGQTLVTEKISSFEGDFTTENRVKVQYQTKRINGYAFLWYLLLLVAFAAFVGGIYFLIRSFIEKKREANEEISARENGVGEAREIEEKQPEIERITDAEVIKPEPISGTAEESEATTPEEASKTEETAETAEDASKTEETAETAEDASKTEETAEATEEASAAEPEYEVPEEYEEESEYEEYEEEELEYEEELETEIPEEEYEEANPTPEIKE